MNVGLNIIRIGDSFALFLHYRSGMGSARTKHKKANELSRYTYLHVFFPFHIFDGFASDAECKCDFWHVSQVHHNFGWLCNLNEIIGDTVARCHVAAESNIQLLWAAVGAIARQSLVTEDFSCSHRYPCGLTRTPSLLRFARTHSVSWNRHEMQCLQIASDKISCLSSLTHKQINRK